MNSKNFDEIKKFLESIPETTLGGDQPEFLYRLALESEGSGKIVEIGTNVGKSTIALAYAQKEKKSDPVCTIDIYEHPKFRKHIEASEVNAYVEQIVSPSHKVAKDWKEPIKLLWIDGDHSYNGVISDIRNWTKYLQEGGLVALHDYPGHKGSKIVHNALMNTLLKNPYQYRMRNDRSAGSIVVFEKITSKQFKKKSALYWQMRNLRSVLSRNFPSLSRKIKRKISS